ncbi:MAG: AAA family ATPase [Deltaproteobacteria bacterium]|nr:AAA family ATPase [Deltaproteobacteria bacterium]
MAQKLLPLPTGQPDFGNLRGNNAVYVDKTAYFPMLKSVSDLVFCTRPRRFGKSLTVSALDAFCSGRNELFQGLAAERFMKSQAFVARPVIHLDMSEVAGSRSIGILEQNVFDILGEIAKRHNIPLRVADPAGAFLFLTKDIRRESDKKIVVLIDEYDAPVINIVQTEGSAEKKRLLDGTRETLSIFYSQIKAAAEHIELVFITGVTKLSRIGVFSMLNGLVDISIMPEFGEFMGNTQKELTDYFAPHIKETADEL